MQKLIAAALFCLGCHGFEAKAQADSSLNAVYNKKIEASGDLYYGIEHIGYLQKMNGTPYFGNNEWQKGSVTSNGVVYKDVQLKYDLLADQLIILHPNNFFAVTLVSDKIQSFTIGNDEFVYVPANNNLNLKQPGFYHVMVNGKLSILAKRSKRIEEKTATGEIERNVVAKAQYYAVKENIATTVTGEESVMNLLGEYARPTRTYLRSREIKYRKSKELALFEIATYYNQLAK